MVVSKQLCNKISKTQNNNKDENKVIEEESKEKEKK